MRASRKADPAVPRAHSVRCILISCLMLSCLTMGRLFLPLVALADAPICGAPPTIETCNIYPSDNIWNTRVDTLPVDARSAAYIANIGPETGLHTDFGSGTWAGGPIGIPYCIVDANQPMVDVSFYYDDESDPGPYPIPPDAPIEGGPASDGDRHVLVLVRGACTLYELYDAHPQPDGSWTAGSGAIYDLSRYALRPDGWTSADAAGLPILPGLIRYEEILAGEIRHAIRFTVAQTRRAYVWPARHYASWSDDLNRPPMGQRFRLRADFDISGYSPINRIILTAMKRYGLILADNGSDWFISGVPDERWDNDVLRELRNVEGSDFEAVDCASLMIDRDSSQAACTAAQAHIPLVQDWNLISTPVLPTDASMAAVFEGLGEWLDVAYAHDAAAAADPWKVYDPSAPAFVNSLSRVDVGMGVWVRSTAATTLAVEGLSPGVTTVPLHEGWNLVGYPSATMRPVAEALASISGHVVTVYGYDTSAPGDPWQVYDPAPSLAPGLTDGALTHLTPGKGYWFDVDAACDWVVYP